MTDKALDLSAFDAADTAELDIRLNGAPTGWKWTIAGPGHPKTVDQVNRLARERLKRDADQERARVNGRKWRPEDDTPAEARERNITMVVERVLGWTAIVLDGKPYPFSAENVRALFLDPRKATIAAQVFEFLGDEGSFSKPSV